MSSSRVTRIWGIIIVTITIFSPIFPAYAQYSGGIGEPNDPYQIASAEDLMLLGETPEDYDKHFILTANIDLSGYAFDRAVIAPDVNDSEDYFQGTQFTGFFDGNDLTISNMIIEGGEYLGLFGWLGNDAKVKNLGVMGVNITGSGGIVGGIVGMNGYRSSITSCYSTGSVSGEDAVGGLVGHNRGSIIASYSTGTVSGEDAVGGLVGRQGRGWADQLVNPILANCYSTGTVSGNENVGGLVGSNGGWEGTSSITNSYSTGTVSGNENVGGLVGGNGGLDGTNSITNSYSTGTVSGNENVGGLVGGNGGLYGTNSITNSYSTGTVSGNENVGGLVGDNGGWEGNYPGIITASFWDVQTSGLINMCGSQDEAIGCDDSFGKTTAEMKTESTFTDAGWDFVGETVNGPNDIWKIVEGITYPLLSWQKYSGGTGEPNDPYQIAAAEDLIALGNEPNDYDKHFILINDIDLAGYVFDKAVIAPDMNHSKDWFQGNAFMGVFNGNDHTILNLHIQGNNYLGLFGLLDSGAIVFRLGMEAVDVNGTGECVGGLVGYNYGIITDCYSTGAVSGNKYVGSLVGYNYRSITSCYSTGVVNGHECVGGLVGGNEFGSITGCYSTGTVSGDGYGFIGGLVGINYRSIAGCYSTGAVSGNWNVGGLVGDNAGRITSCYSTGAVSGNWNVGGLVGENWTGIITSSYSIGTVNETDNVGGLVGWNSGSINSSFWDMQTSGQTTSAGGTGKATAEMQDINTYLNVNWDFIDEVAFGTCDYWQISQGDYPRLTYPMMPEGLGTPEQPYLIRDANDLGTVWSKPSAHYRLEASIDLSGITWSMAVIPWFGGTFDGNGYSISNLTIQGNNYVGLFGQLGWLAMVSNLGMEVIDVNGTGDYVGGLVGYNIGRITRCYSTGVVSGRSYVGGLMGENDSGIITNCYSTGTVNGTDNVGGLGGCNDCGTVVQCYSNCIVDGNNYVGGLVGNDYIGYIINCYSTGLVSGTSFVGGLMGRNESSSINSSFWDIETSGQTTSAGGIGKTMFEMKTKKTFVVWDFVGVWSICEGTNYPRFVWQIPAGDFLCPDGITLEEDFDFFMNRYGDSNCDSSNGYCDGTDLDFSGTVDINDFLILLNNWLKENS